MAGVLREAPDHAASSSELTGKLVWSSILTDAALFH